MLNFGKIFRTSGQKEEYTEALPQTQNAAVTEQTPQAVEKQEENPTQIATVEVTGDLLALHKRWKPEEAAKELVLADGDEIVQYELLKGELERERIRIMMSLEKASQRKVELIRKREALEAVPKQDAEPVCMLSKDKMLAWLFVFAPIGEGDKISKDVLQSELAKAGVSYGLLQHKLDEIVQQEQYFKLVLVAVGKRTIEGKDGTVAECYPRKISHQVQLNEDGVADYRSLNYVQVVEKGDVICNITLPVPGEPGIQVDGKEAKPKAVHNAPVRRGTNTEFTEDGTKLIASQPGHLEFSDEAFQVRSVLEVKSDVDYSTGNIDFPGDVHVFGDVRENFTVRAGGSILVDGLVEAATMDAEGDLVITKGVVGDNRAVLKSRGEIHTQFLENCKVYVHKCVYADCIMTSNVCSDGSICVSSGRGIIVGGTITAAHSITAKEIGAKSGMQTQIELGAMPYLESKVAALNEILEGSDQQLERFNKDIEYLEKRTKYPEDLKRLTRTKIKKTALERKCAQAVQELHEIQISKPDITKCRLECETVYPNTIVKIGGAMRSVEHIQNKYKLRFDQETHDIVEMPC